MYLLYSLGYVAYLYSCPGHKEDGAMTTLSKTLILTAAAVLTMGAADRAVANGCCGGGGGYGGYGGGFGAYSANPYYPSDRRIPYFAEHPPVYYSYPVPRTYGYSPYASPPTYTVPEVRMEPVIIENPHVEATPSSTKVEDRAADARRTIQPLVIYNPYVGGAAFAAGR